MTEITGYRGSRFDTGGTRPLLHDTWQALDELAGQADVWLEVLAGAKYRRQLSELAKHAINNPDYVLQVVLRLPGTDTMVGDEYLDKAHRLLKDLPGGSFTTLREGSVTPPKVRRAFWRCRRSKQRLVYP